MLHPPPQEDKEHADGWERVRAASLEALNELLDDSVHGLCSDFVAYDKGTGRYHAVTCQVLERPGDGTFSWNACRCAPSRPPAGSPATSLPQAAGSCVRGPAPVCAGLRRCLAMLVLAVPFNHLTSTELPLLADKQWLPCVSSSMGTARRMPWRVAVYFWETGDKRVLPLMHTLAKFFNGQKQARSLGPQPRSLSGQGDILGQEGAVTQQPIPLEPEWGLRTSGDGPN